MTPRTIYLLLACALFMIEVLIATALRHWSFVRGSLGDVLVTGLLYCMALAFRDFNRPRLALSIFGFACLVEYAQHLRLAQALGLPPGSVLRIVLGDSFQWQDIVCYFVGCAAALTTDTLVRRLASAS